MDHLRLLYGTQYLEYSWKTILLITFPDIKHQNFLLKRK
jgi:hypothetical protein